MDFETHLKSKNLISPKNKIEIPLGMLPITSLLKDDFLKSSRFHMPHLLQKKFYENKIGSCHEG